MKRVVWLLALLIVAAIAVGCGTIKTDGGSVSLKNGAVEVKGDDGTTIKLGENGEVQAKSGDGTETASLGTTLPEGYPKDVLPLMDGAKILQGMKTETTYSVTFETKATPQEALRFYENILKGKAGYTFTDLTKDDKPGYALIVYGDDGTLSSLIQVSSQGTTVVELAVAR